MFYKVKILRGVISSGSENEEGACARMHQSQPPLEVTNVTLFSTTNPLMLLSRVRGLPTTGETCGLKPCFSTSFSVGASQPRHSRTQAGQISPLCPGSPNPRGSPCPELWAGSSSSSLSVSHDLSNGFALAHCRGLGQRHRHLWVSERHLGKRAWEPYYCNASTILELKCSKAKAA